MSEHGPWARAVFAEGRLWLACECGWNARGDAGGTYNEHIAAIEQEAAELDVERMVRVLAVVLPLAPGPYERFAPGVSEGMYRGLVERIAAEYARAGGQDG